MYMNKTNKPPMKIKKSNMAHHEFVMVTTLEHKTTPNKSKKSNAFNGTSQISKDIKMVLEVMITMVITSEIITLMNLQFPKLMF
uniref:NADH dehydrogenase subunit 6 n=1 Tax=Eleutherocaulis alte TaxID=74076 RepID=A0A1P7YWD8_9EUPU|nr:NADH dehydrogenase subunit 6 [Eleutherocaulis alte]